MTNRSPSFLVATLPLAISVVACTVSPSADKVGTSQEAENGCLSSPSCPLFTETLCRGVGPTGCPIDCSCAEVGTTLASGLPADPFPIVVDGSNVYWGDESGNVMSVPVGGGTPATLISGQGFVLSIAPYYGPRKARFTSTSLLFWSASTTIGGVEVAPRTGTPFTVATDNNDLIEIALDSQNVYWTDYDYGNGDGAVMRAPVGGGPAAMLATGGSPFSLAIDGTNVYWADGNGYLWKMPKTGGPRTALASALAVDAYVPYIALDSDPTVGSTATNVYWSQPGSGVLEDGAVMSVPVMGGTPTTVASGTSPGTIYADSAGVYWSDGLLGTINVVRLPLGTGGPAVLAANQGWVMAIAVDSTSVYWTTKGLGPGTGTGCVRKTGK
jgi:hypothetical protein